MTTVQLTSSGIDSACIAHLAHSDKQVYFHLGAPYNNSEALHLPFGTLIDYSIKLGHRIRPNHILPRRNAFLILAAAFYGDRVLLGSTAGDTTKDKDTVFLQHMNNLLEHMGSDPGKCEKAVVVAPFAHLTKRELVAKYLKEGGAPASLRSAWSCYNVVGDQECGECRSCIRKYTALELNGIDTTNVFLHDPRGMLVEALHYAIKQGRGHEINDLREMIK